MGELYDVTGKAVASGERVLLWDWRTAELGLSLAIARYQRARLVSVEAYEAWCKGA